MSFDVQELLRRQAEWQRSRQALSWPEKIRMAQEIRESIRTLRATSAKNVSQKPQPRPRPLKPA
jgi:hypothetical protein